MSSDVTIQDVFQRFLPDYSEIHHFSDRQYLTTKCIINCRTAEMGAHVSECDSCHSKYIHYNSCKNRHCPMCQGMDVDEWIDLQQENVLDTAYFHTVFTLPEEVYPLIYSNQKVLYNAIYHAANQTLAELSGDEKYLGAKIGYICVLHTWGSRMNFRPHLHAIDYFIAFNSLDSSIADSYSVRVSAEVINYRLRSIESFFCIGNPFFLKQDIQQCHKLVIILQIFSTAVIFKPFILPKFFQLLKIILLKYCRHNLNRKKQLSILILPMILLIKSTSKHNLHTIVLGGGLDTANKWKDMG